MRLWSIHPSYLDSKGLVAVWREGLLAQKVLLGQTKGYKHHPQLDRFKKKGINFIRTYLYDIAKEMIERHYNPNILKLDLHLRDYLDTIKTPLTITEGQLDFEFDHLQTKLYTRNTKKFKENEISTLIRDKNKWKKTGLKFHKIKPHPLFNVIEGDIESWEKRK